jgi:hypothetical protein
MKNETTVLPGTRLITWIGGVQRQLSQCLPGGAKEFDDLRFGECSAGIEYFDCLEVGYIEKCLQFLASIRLLKQTVTSGAMAETEVGELSGQESLNGVSMSLHAHVCWKEPLKPGNDVQDLHGSLEDRLLRTG